MSWKTLSPESPTYTYEYFSNECVCRICWCQEAVKEITSTSSNKLCGDVTFADKISECMSMDLTTRPGPNKICTDCCCAIDNLYEFRRFCVETEQKLFEILQNEPKHDETDDFIDIKDPELTQPIENLFTDLNSTDRGKESQPKQERAQNIKSETYCTSCKIYLNSEIYSKHNLDFHGIDLQNGMYKCFGCEKVFSKKLQMLRHERESCKNLEKGYKCKECEKFLPKRSVLEKHLKNHRENVGVSFVEELFKCKDCDKKFTSKELLKEHVTTHAGWRDKNNWVCDICGRVFSRRDYLYKHKLMHDGRKQHACPHCSFKTVQKSSLTVHIRKHTGERPYSCDLCPQRCVNSSNLREHRKRHFGIKRFECQLCDKKFGYKISLNEHISSIHERSEMHSCADCGATYSRYRDLRRHLLAKHGKRVRKKGKMPVEIEHIGNENTTASQVLGI